MFVFRVGTMCPSRIYESFSVIWSLLSSEVVQRLCPPCVHRVISFRGRVLTSEVRIFIVELVAYEVNASEAVISNLVEP